ncbi:hypothetical protein M2150_001659 [Lachnospiraceae bacterium PM6-15]|uniref:hypothetical protein n=1 Tax=Ohessyouella blattaphilus TaxID=2949333 RepID=UPI003E237CC3
MNKNQKAFVKRKICSVVKVVAIIVLLYVLARSPQILRFILSTSLPFEKIGEIIGEILLIIIALAVGMAVIILLRDLINDYKIAGVLSESEYKEFMEKKDFYLTMKSKVMKNGGSHEWNLFKESEREYRNARQKAIEKIKFRLI